MKLINVRIGKYHFFLTTQNILTSWKRKENNFEVTSVIPRLERMGFYPTWSKVLKTRKSNKRNLFIFTISPG